MAKCGAKTRAGSPCQRSGRANGRCNLHGGKTPKGQRNAVKHGFYAKALTAPEKEVWHEIPLGSLDEEIRLARVLLLRAMIGKLPDQAALMLRRIERLEATRAAMNDKGQGAVDAAETARKIRQFMTEMEEQGG